MSVEVELLLDQRNFFQTALGRGTTKNFARTGRSRSYEDRWETAAYQDNMTAILTGKHAIFGLTQPLETA